MLTEMYIVTETNGQVDIHYCCKPVDALPVDTTGLARLIDHDTHKVYVCNILDWLNKFEIH